VGFNLLPAHTLMCLQDFSGFRLLVLLPRERVMWPAPGQYDKPEPKKHPLLGAPLDPLPGLQVCNDVTRFICIRYTWYTGCLNVW
jgi:hypothetical protein